MTNRGWIGLTRSGRAHIRDCWFPEILHGRYQGHSSNAWVVLVDDDTRGLPDDVRAIYR